MWPVGRRFVSHTRLPLEFEARHHVSASQGARSVGVKSVQMIHVKELFDLTGYVRGGCTAIGMKKNFVTRLDETAMLFDEIYISGGRIGCQIRLRPDDFLQAAWKAEYADLTRD